MSLIAIGDVHGCPQTLEALLDRLQPTADDEVVFIGDYVDRGPNSRGVITLLIKLQGELNCVFLRGNHEMLMLNYIDHGEYESWAMNGGVMTLNSYLNTERHIDIPSSHIEFLRRTKLYHDTEEFFFVHAGIDPRMTVQENMANYTEDMFLWERSHLRARKVAWEKTVVCGHTPVETPTNKPHLINVDTGCVYFMHPERGKLTAVRLPEREFISVEYQD